MHKYIIILLLLLPLAAGQEQPLARIEVCDAEGNCHIAKPDEYVQVWACSGQVILKSASYDPLGLPLSSVWNVNGDRRSADQLSFSWPRSDYVRILLNVSNGKFYNLTAITAVVKESKAAVLEEASFLVGSDEKEITFEPKQQQKVARTAPGIPVTVKRTYKEEVDEERVLNPAVSADASVNIESNKCDSSDECENVLNFSKIGNYNIVFRDQNSCGKAEDVIVRIEVVNNHPPNKVAISGEFGGESSVALSGEESEDNDLNLKDEITKYSWTVTDENGDVVEEYVSEYPDFYFSAPPGAYNATLCATDRFGGTACSDPKKVLILGLETLKADPSETLREFDISKNITLNAEQSMPKRNIDRYKWTICYYYEGQCRDEQIFSTSKPVMNIAVSRSGEYNVKLTIYAGNKTDSAEFRIIVKNASEILAESGVVSKIPTVAEAESSGTETSAMPAPGIILTLAVFLLVLFAKKRKR